MVFNDKVVNWIESFPKERTLNVSVNGSISPSIIFNGKLETIDNISMSSSLDLILVFLQFTFIILPFVFAHLLFAEEASMSPGRPISKVHLILVLVVAFVRKRHFEDRLTYH